MDARAVANAAERLCLTNPFAWCPPTWKIHAAADPTPQRSPADSLRTVGNRVFQRLGQHVPSDLADEALTHFRLAAI
jgi:hypothetical protein